MTEKVAYNGNISVGKEQESSRLDYPFDYDDNLRYRGKLLARCDADKELRSYVYRLCKRDILTWIDLFAWTKDPRKKPSELAWISYPFQRKAIKHIEGNIGNQEDLLIDKSRDMGATWMVIMVLMHKWLFENGSDFLIGSRKEDFVDKQGDISTLFEKCRFLVEYMPGWMLPEGYVRRKHQTYMKLINPEIGNVIVGESANPTFSSGGRYKAILLDEFAKWDVNTASSAWTATADASPSRIPLSTPFGAGNKFAELSKGTKEHIDKLTLHWTLHPEKAKGLYYVDGLGTKHEIEDRRVGFEMWRQGKEVRSPWYDAEDARRSEDDMAQEIDINYLKSGRPYFDIEALTKQRKWEEYKRKSPLDGQQWGKFFRVNLVKKFDKVKMIDNPDGWLKIFRLPEAGHEYVVGGDPSEGLPKGDESWIVIRNKVTNNVVATANGAIEPDDMAIKMDMAGIFYNNALIVPENNNHGYTVCLHLEKDLGANLYYMLKDEYDKQKGKLKKTPKRGWTTSSTTRPLMLDLMESDVRNKNVQLRDPDLIAQCETVVTKKGGKIEADGEYLDDAVFACAISGAVMEQVPYESKSKSKETKRKLRQRVAEIKGKSRRGLDIQKHKRKVKARM